MNTSWLDYISFMQLTFKIKYKHIYWITGFKSAEMQIRAVSLQHPNQAKHICIRNSDMYHIVQKEDACSLKWILHIDCTAIFTIWCHYQKTSSSTSGEIRSKLGLGRCRLHVSAFLLS